MAPELGDVVVGQEGRAGEVEAHRGGLRRRVPPAKHVDRLGEQPGVHLEPDRGHEAVLLGAEDVAGAADLEVAERDLVAGAEVGRREDRVQPLARDVGERAWFAGGGGRRRRAGRSGRPGRAAGRAGPGRSVSARTMMIVFAFGMSRPDSMIVVHTSTSNFAVVEVEHHPLEHPLRHLPVADGDARLGDEPRTRSAAASIVSTRLWT